MTGVPVTDAAVGSAPGPTRPPPGTAPAARPQWLSRVADAVAASGDGPFRTFAPPLGTHRRSAVLMLFGPADAGAGEDVLLTERAMSLRAHPGQVSFPGGSVDPGDHGPVGAALREAQEEVGLDPHGVEVVATLPELFLSPSRNAVTPVLAWWARPSPVRAVDEAEVARVARVPLRTLLDPARRFTATHPAGHRGPAFEADGLFVWGFTALLLTTLFDAAGLTRPWDDTVERPLPERLRVAWERRGT